MKVLPEEFSSEPRLYGNVNISDNEKKVLELPPKYGIYKKVSVRDCIISVEESLNKLRWNRIINNQNVRQEEKEFINTTDNHVNINLLKPSELPFNNYAKMPTATRFEEEVRLQQFKNRVVESAKKISRESDDWVNLDEELKKGLEILQERVRKREMVCFVTDKSGRWACDSLENYRDNCMKLVENEDKTPQISIAEHNRAERELNCHAMALIRMMGVQNGVTEDKLKKVLVADGSRLAPLYGLRKDHKEWETGQAKVEAMAKHRKQEFKQTFNKFFELMYI